MLLPFLLPILISVTLWPPAQTSIWAKSPRGAWDYHTTEGFQINTLKATAYAQSHLINIADSICSGKWWEVMSLVLGKCILFMRFTILTAVCSEGQFCTVVSGPSLQPIEHGQQKRIFTLPRNSFSTHVVSSSCAKQQANTDFMRVWRYQPLWQTLNLTAVLYCLREQVPPTPHSTRNNWSDLLAALLHYCHPMEEGPGPGQFFHGKVRDRPGTGGKLCLTADFHSKYSQEGGDLQNPQLQFLSEHNGSIS